MNTVGFSRYLSFASHSLTSRNITLGLVLFLSLVFSYHAWNALSVFRGADTFSLAGQISGIKSDRSAGLKSVMAANLFKKANESMSHESSEALFAKPFTLSGTFAGVGGASSYAIITKAGEPGKIVHAGESLDDDIKVGRIYSDRVVIEKGSLSSVLYMKDNQ